MPWNIVDGAIQVGEGGNPIWIPEEGADDSTPAEVDWKSALSTIGRLNSESKEKRELAETLTGTVTELEAKIAGFGDIDPAAAKDAILKLANIDQGALLTADKVASFKSSILEAAEAEKGNLVKEYTERITTTEQERDEAHSKINRLVIGNSFAGSQLAKKLTVPPDMLEQTFSEYFKVEDDKPVAYLNGNKINSRKRPGETATFDESLEIIIDQYPHKHMLFPGTPGGSGGQGGQGGEKFATTDEIKGMSLTEYAAAKAAGRIHVPVG